MPSATETVNLGPALESLRICRRLTTTLVEPIPDDKLTLRACPDSNHAAFVLGHIAKTDDWFMSALGGPASTLPESWGPLFDGGAELRDSREEYPSKQELLDAMTDRREAMIGWLCSLSPQELLAPLRGGIEKIAPTLAALPSSTCLHEGLHAGQISTIRRALGIPRLG